MGWLSFIVGEFCHFFRLFRHCFLMSLHLRTLFLLVVTFRPSYHISARKSIFSPLCLTRDDNEWENGDGGWWGKKQRKKKNASSLNSRSQGLGELFNKHQTHAKSQRKKSTYTHYTVHTHKMAFFLRLSFNHVKKLSG